MEGKECKYEKIINLLEKRIDTISVFLIVSTGTFLFGNLILLCLLYILVNH